MFASRTALRSFGALAASSATVSSAYRHANVAGTREWARLTGLAGNGQVSIAPVLLIGDGGYACEDVVENRIRGQAAPEPAPAPQSQAGQVSLAGEIAGRA